MVNPARPTLFDKAYKMNEQWKPVRDYEGFYEISDRGRLKSLRRDIIMKPAANRGGYLYINLWNKNRYRDCRSIHRLVLESFISIRPFGYECDHIDSNPSNNCLQNLEWVTPEENTRRMHLLNNQKGQNHPNAILNDEKIRQIREEYAVGKTTYKRLAQKFGVYYTCIGKIICRELWKHVA